MHDLIPAEKCPRAILFDLDNTLHDFTDAKQKASSSVCEYIGVGRGEELVEYFIFKGLGYENPENIRLFMQDKGVYSEDEYLRAADIYEKSKLDNVVAYDGVTEVIKKIYDAGIHMAIVTDAPSNKAKSRLDKIGVSKYFESVVGPDISGKRKPEFDSFKVGLERLNASADETMVVGDSLFFDITPCMNRGMTTVYARYGNHFPMPCKEADPDYTIDSIYDLEIILGL